MSNLMITLVKHHLEASGGMFVLAMVLADAARDDGTRLFISVPMLAKFSRQSDRTVQNQLKKLVKSGWLIPVSISKGPGYANGYRINPVWIEEVTKKHAKYLAERDAERQAKAFNKKGLWSSLDNNSDKPDPEKYKKEMGEYHDMTGENESKIGEKLLHPIPYIDNVVVNNITSPDEFDIKRFIIFEMHVNWNPGPLFPQKLEKNNVSEKMFTTARLAEFISYWQSQPQIQLNQGGWEHKFMQRLDLIQRREDHDHGADCRHADMPNSLHKHFDIDQ